MRVPRAATAAPTAGARLRDAAAGDAAWDWEAAAERHLTMGRHSYHRPKVIVFPGDTARVFVGNFCSIYQDVEIIPGGNHHIHTVSSFAFRAHWNLPGSLEDGMPSSKGDVRIGNDVYIGMGAVILSGVTIGDGAVIGARAVVARDVRPYAVAVGNPAREVRRRFSDDAVDALLEIRWWDWPDEVIRERIDDLSGAAIEDFIARHRA